MSTWVSDTPPPEPGLGGARGWLRILLRGLPGLLVLAPGLALLLALRGAERLVAHRGRPLSGWVTVGVCRVVLALFGLRVTRHGAPMPGPGVILANHSSWLDIFVLNAAAPVTFVSKAEVARWPGIGWLARGTGTIFVERTRRAARDQVAELQARAGGPVPLVLFPEGTSTDGRRVLPFKPTLLAASLAARTPVQPVSVSYHAPSGADPRFYGWWGEMAFGPHLLGVLAAARQGHVEVRYHNPIATDGGLSRKVLAAQAEETVRSGMAL